MFRLDQLSLDFGQWQSWVVLVAGLAVAGLVFLGGLALFRWFAPACVSLASDAPPERRGSVRKNGTLAGVLVSDADVMTVPRRALVLDRSKGGLRLSADAPMALGSILSVRSTKSTAEGVWLRVEVVRCKSVDRGWELGCQFLQQPGGEA